MISENYLNIWVEQLFLHFFNTPLLTTAFGFIFKILDLYLNEDELFVGTLPAFPASVTDDSSLWNCHKRPDVSE